MRITVKERGGKNLHLCIPNGLVLNRLSAGILSAALKDKSPNISGRQLHILFRAIKTYKATHPQWRLAEVQSPNGEMIVIII